MSVYVVSRDKLEHNIKELKKLANGVPIWAVIKGDGYGLGALPLAEVLQEQGIENFCVTDLREAQILRENGFSDARILMLRSVTDRELIGELLDLRVIMTVGSMEAAKMVEDVASHRADVAQVHVKVDTGMGRYGFHPQEIEKIAAVYREMSHIAVSGIYTHFNCAFCDDELTKQEFSEFSEVLKQLHALGIETGTAHCCNSAAFLKHPEMHMDGVRLGSAILGRMAFQTRLRPVGYVKTQVEELHVLKKGQTTGYGAMWKAKRESVLAIIPVGRFHGFCLQCQPAKSRKDCLREILSNLKSVLRPSRTTVEVNGKTCRVVGAVGMLHCAVDVTDIDCKRGDRVTVQINPLYVKGLPVQFK